MPTASISSPLRRGRNLAVVGLEIGLDLVGLDAALARDQAAGVLRVLLHPMGGADGGLGIADNRVEMFLDRLARGGEDAGRRVVDALCEVGGGSHIVEQADGAVGFLLEEARLWPLAEDRVDLAR